MKTIEEEREKLIGNIAELLKTYRFTFEFEVKKNPQGIKVIWEVTQEEMNALMNKAIEKEDV